VDENVILTRFIITLEKEKQKVLDFNASIDN